MNLIQHTRCPACLSLRPLEDGECWFTGEDDNDEPDIFWQCPDCMYGVAYRVNLTVFAIPKIQRIITDKARRSQPADKGEVGS